MQRAIQKIQRLQLGPIRHGQIEFIWSKTGKTAWCEIFFRLQPLQQVLDYRDLDYRDPCNTGIDKKFCVP